MAKGKKTGGRDFEPGESGNPSGRPNLPEEIKQGRKLNNLELEYILTKYLRCSSAFLMEASRDVTLPALDQIAIRIILKAIESGDHFRMNFILERLVGKAPDRSLEGEATSVLTTFVEIIRKAKEIK